MLSRVAAGKAPRTHNRRRVTGSSGMRREGRESEPQRPHMSRRVITSAVLLLVVMGMCCNTVQSVVVSNSGRGVDPFVPQTTLVQSEDGTVPVTTRDSFASPSPVSAGGVIAAFAEGHTDAEYQGGQLSEPFSSDVLARCIDSAWDWSTVVGEVNKRYMEGTHCAWCSGGKGEFGCCAPPHNNYEGPRSVSSCGRL
ncbi:trans-sialidase [Trypanosoma cruzi]|nr:trans-sialidase [Trypanosoma cruzi]